MRSGLGDVLRPGRVLAQVAACHLLLRRYRASSRWLEQAVAAQPDGRGRDRATYYIWSADSALHLGEVEQACALLTRAIPDITAARSHRNQRRLTDVRIRLNAHQNLPAVREFDDRLRSEISEIA